MGWWGNLGSPTQRGVVTYSLSAFEQRYFAGVLHNAIFNTSRRVLSQVPYVGTAFALGYFIYTSAKSRHAYLTSKAGHAEAEGH
ncbi:ubiquinol--cytochrome-c reductase subunit 8 [Apophysomyces ossiformis]|uniref:Cytochrome b-c1 complex subunit 8 n=1 Tax=Apophysomyces ossiformis TaxID=679940 RepID=A0A8H7BF91_9FUNG|nr:ubiquinol--cytochrome-c reductase subunit 8 [Apophysomyces ossiformis]